MEDITKGKFGPVFEETPWPKKAIGSLSFRDAGASSSMTKSYVQFSSTNSTLTQAANHTNKMVENPIAVPTEKNPINGSGGTFGAGAGAGEGQAALPVANLDPKRLNRIQRNRIAAQKSRMRKMEYMLELEMLATSLESKITFLHPQIEAYKHKKQSLEVERTNLKLKMATYEKQRVLEEVEIEKNKEELNRLWKLQLKQQEQFQAQGRMLNSDAVVQSMTNSNPNHFGLALYANQVPNGVVKLEKHDDGAENP